MSDLTAILDRIPDEQEMRGFAVGAVSFSGQPAVRKALFDLVDFCRNRPAEAQNALVNELGRLIQKAHAAWVASGAPGADP